MPLYEFICSACENDFSCHYSIAERDTQTECPACNSTETRRIISQTHFVLKGDGWPGKNNRIKNQMAEKNSRLNVKQNERKKEQPTITLAPNVEGERVDSWSEAKKLAASKGKDINSYDSYVRSEKT